jgi:hypothetical protein
VLFQGLISPGSRSLDWIKEEHLKEVIPDERERASVRFDRAARQAAWQRRRDHARSIGPSVVGISQKPTCTAQSKRPRMTGQAFRCYKALQFLSKL